MLPTKIQFIWTSGFREEELKKLPAAAMFVNGLRRNVQCFREPSIDASYQVSVHLAKRFQRRIFYKLTNQIKEMPVGGWRPCLMMDWDEMCNLYRRPSIDASYQVSVHLAKWFERRLKCEKLTDDGRQVMEKAHIAFDKVS